MEFRELMQVRRSVRAYEAREVEAAKLESVLEAARAAPSAGNLQAYEVWVVSHGAVKTALAHAALNQMFVAEAAAVLVFMACPGRSAVRYGERGEQLYAVQDATLACAYAQLAATELGLATCWVGAFHDDRVRAALADPEDRRPVAILPVGYAAEAPGPTGRRALRELVRREGG
jgi:nitroreductase